MYIKFFAFVFVAFSTTACSNSKKAMVTPDQPLATYEVLKDNDGSKMLKGIVTKDQITQDTSFHWYADNLKFFKPDADAIAAVKAKAEKISIVIFGGTWCHDTQNLLPKYLSLLDAAQFPASQLTLIAVDRAKTTIGNIQKPFNITNVPTAIVMKDGKEVGRIIEYGKTALVDKELGAIIASIQ